MDEKRYPPPVDRLLTLGDPPLDHWADYGEMGIGRENIPDLIRLATDDALWDADDDLPEAWGPVHAWRALGQLRAEETIEPLVGLFARADTLASEWVLDELPDVFGMIGPAAIPAVSAWLADTSHNGYERAAAATSLVRMAKQHPGTRDECVSHIAQPLDREEDFDVELNAFVVGDLLDLHAVEMAPVIERAFAAGRVAEGISGTWDYVQEELGLKERAEPAPNVAPRPQLVSPGTKTSSEKAKARAKRKQAKKARRQNRKR